MERVIYGINILNYIIVLTMIFIFRDALSSYGFYIVATFSATSLLLSIIYSIYYRYNDDLKNHCYISVFINLFNIIIIATALLIFLF
ncbi:hypothetical protein HMPREF2864_06760 [Staphylococcus sp. HMSC059F04]|uniref:hypothetical protein n=1 Tax=Staphylococcus sp. HMSC059F04 TaxID=1739368 RepID=UPI0008A185E6|nr:hypothetical protein [Staphylococcus sp. HMSC059F04]OFR91077.1 hypothetical protein HMPREF2864_06760 [Staphylococcus sp. HMSC059F04]